MKKFYLAACIFAAIVTAPAQAQKAECVKPKYARAALQKAYLLNLTPDTDIGTARSRIDAETFKGLDKIVFDVFMCFGKHKRCPDDKKQWTRQDHQAIGEQLITAYERTGKVSNIDARYFRNLLDATLQDSECSDF